MWIIILTTIVVAFASGISMGLYLEREIWEAALRNAVIRLNAEEEAAVVPSKIRMFASALCRIPITFLNARASLGLASNDNFASTHRARLPALLTVSDTKRLS